MAWGPGRVAALPQQAAATVAAGGEAVMAGEEQQLVAGVLCTVVHGVGPKEVAALHIRQRQ